MTISPSHFVAFIESRVPPRLLIGAIARKHYLVGERMLRLLPQLVDRRRMSLDIGANKGVYTYFLSRLCPSVCAYEPNPELFAFLRRAARRNVEVRSLALSDHCGEATLSVPVVNRRQIPGHGRLAPAFPYAVDRLETFRVQLRRLDDCGHRDVGFIKIDVEGHEEAVLDGAANLFERDRPTLVIEIEQRHIAKDIHDVFRAVTRHGYRGSFLDGGRFTPLERFDPAHDQDPRIADVRGARYINNFVFEPTTAAWVSAPGREGPTERPGTSASPTVGSPT